MSDEKKCWLCHERKPLRDSHIIPKFVFRWLIKTGGTPYLRHGASPNRRVQDGDKHQLYCQECETLLSKFEQKAERRLFTPATNSERLAGWYGPWLSRFAASLSIRTLHSQKLRGIVAPSCIDTQKIDQAEARWRTFLLGQQVSPKQNSLFMLYPGYFTNFHAESLPQNWNRFVHRMVERDLAYTDSGSFCATYTKIGPLIFFGKIEDQNNELFWERIACSEGRYQSPFPVDEKGFFWNWLCDRAKNAELISQIISDVQAKKTEAQITRDPDRFLASDMARRMADDIQQFGIRKPER